MNLKAIKKYGGKVIEIKYELGWRKPIQATYWFIIEGTNDEISYHDYFAEWDSVEDALKFFFHHHTEPIFIDPQIQYCEHF